MASWNTVTQPAYTPLPRNTRVGETSSAHTSSLPAHIQSYTQQPSYIAASLNQEAYDGNLFSSKLYDMLMSETVSKWIGWYQHGGSSGLWIPNVDDFVANALPKWFPEMNKGWASFQKQLSNYGFEKRNRASTNKSQALYVHWNNMFCRGRPDLLPQVTRQPKDSTSQDSVHEHPPASNISAVPQPLGLPNPEARFFSLQNQLATITLELNATHTKFLEMTASALQLASKLKAMETSIWQMSSELNAMSIGNGPSRSEVLTGLAERAIAVQCPMSGVGYPSGIPDGPAHGPPIDADNGGAGVPSYTTPGMSLDRINPTPLHPPSAHSQIQGNTTSFPNSSLTPDHAAGSSTFGEPLLAQHSSTTDAGPTFTACRGQPGPSAGAQTFSPSAPASSSQLQTPPQGLSLSMTSNRRFDGATLVPSPPAPWSSGNRASGPTNAGHQ
ncbi:hypothetical protein FRC04_003046 [Tulasnella sp. 424]|nr:hypothetical protein FRC04_003046 [Tulasnella sp. 424]